MRVQVTFRINTETGEVEFFQVDDMGRTRQLTDHDARARGHRAGHRRRSSTPGPTCPR